MKPKKQTHDELPMMEVSPAEIRLAQDAMKQFEHTLHQAGSVDAKTAFAEETVRQVLRKLETMQTSLGERCLVAFDYNENLLLLAAIQVFLIDLMASPPTPQRTEQLRQCERLKTFALLALEAAQAHPTQD